MSAAVIALNNALQILAGIRANHGVDDGANLFSAERLIIQGRDVLVQTEQDLRTSSASTLAAHKRLHALELYVADVRRTLQELELRESIALQSHGDRVKLVTNLRARDPEPRVALPSFAVSTDTPRPVAAGVK